MDDHFSRLEAKVNGAIELIQQLRRENGEWKVRYAEIEGRLHDTQGERDRLQVELQEIGERAGRVEEFEETRRVIQQKVGSLLEKLEAMG